MNERISLWTKRSGDEGLVWRLKTDPAFDPIREKQVFIWSEEHGYYWGPEKSGYFDRDKAGIYSFSNAYRYTAGCGPEKKIAYELASSGIPNLQFSQQCSWIAKNASAWAGDLLTLPEKVNEEAYLVSVRRFCDSVRRQLEIIENWGSK